MIAMLLIIITLNMLIGIGREVKGMCAPSLKKKLLVRRERQQQQ